MLTGLAAFAVVKLLGDGIPLNCDGLGIIEDPKVVRWFTCDGVDIEKLVLKLSDVNVDIVVGVTMVDVWVFDDHEGGERNSCKIFEGGSLAVGELIFTDSSLVSVQSFSMIISCFLSCTELLESERRVWSLDSGLSLLAFLLLSLESSAFLLAMTACRLLSVLALSIFLEVSILVSFDIVSFRSSSVHPEHLHFFA